MALQSRRAEYWWGGAVSKDRTTKTGAHLPCAVNDGALLNKPAGNGATGACIELAWPSPLDFAFASPLVGLGDSLLPVVGEQLVGAVHLVILALVEGLDGEGIAQPWGR